MVVIGNPPYNANQVNENENNKNREYPDIDKRIKETYIKHSTAQKTKLYDMYARFYRWATDVDKNGIIAFITNNSFFDSRTFDGFRKMVTDEFSYIYIVDLGGNVGRSQTGKCFWYSNRGCITFMVKTVKKGRTPAQIFYYHPGNLSASDKLDFFDHEKISTIQFQHIHLIKNDWINLTNNDWDELLPLVIKPRRL